MKKLIYSQEDVDLMNCLEADEYYQALLDIKEYIEKSYKEDYGNNENYIPIEHLNLKNCTYERSLVVLDIVNQALANM